MRERTIFVVAATKKNHIGWTNVCRKDGRKEMARGEGKNNSVIFITQFYFFYYIELFLPIKFLNFYFCFFFR